MGEQPAARHLIGRVLARAEDDLIAIGIRACLDVSCRRGGNGIVVNSYIGEIAPEARFEEIACVGGQWTTRRPRRHRERWLRRWTLCRRGATCAGASSGRHAH